ncbi:unnamed protein product [Kuraishia capsulata CBS 1993]|uniref:L-lactate dehydrogenase (cytochrome) n=1 Tax=Kuraishia capsulata CBS 1993 TaxID=1382522 RepID=W6MMK6_9ASCO|nr:uncharacterized protein KUCA_T00003416001 [Kuraishia capsulata CBS 1993]CDK27438.1 unnamed protein product [Kuraishia capsulata CBS 1993]
MFRSNFIRNSRSAFKQFSKRSYSWRSVSTSPRLAKHATSALAIGLSSAIVLSVTSSIISNDIKYEDKLFPEPKLIPVDEFLKHNKPDDCWVVLNGWVYDMTEFKEIHPGGRNVIIRNAGKDATKIFTPIHPPDAIEKFLPAEKIIGKLDGIIEQEEEEDPDELERQERISNIPSLNQVYNIADFENIAKQILPKGAWAYYSSGADDEITLRENHYAYHRVFFRPRILVDVSEIDLSTTMLGQKTSAPFYISATALARLGHPDGEVAIAKAAGREDIIQMISTLASASLDEITEVATEDQKQWFQLYVNADRNIAYKMVANAESKKSIKGIFITVDAPSLGNREKDKKIKFEGDTDVDLEDNADRASGASRALSSFIDTALTWKDIDVIKQKTKLPIVIKGIQRAEDALKAAEHGVDAIVLSNHGGRQLDFAPAPLQLLSDIMPVLREKKLDGKMEVFVDGGVRRGTDVLKALCLGATGVGIGRPVLYSMSAYGEAGVTKAIQLLKDELEMDMRLLGVTKISDLGPEFVDTRGLIGVHAKDMLYDNLYAPLEPVKFKDE